jgi:hypothetical protein
MRKCENSRNISDPPRNPQKRTRLSMIVMSALCQKETLSGSFNHLIGAVEQKKSPDISAGVSDLIL